MRAVAVVFFSLRELAENLVQEVAKMGGDSSKMARGGLEGAVHQEQDHPKTTIARVKAVMGGGGRDDRMRVAARTASMRHTGATPSSEQVNRIVVGAAAYCCGFAASSNCDDD